MDRVYRASSERRLFKQRQTDRVFRARSGHILLIASRRDSAEDIEFFRRPEIGIHCQWFRYHLNILIRNRILYGLAIVSQTDGHIGRTKQIFMLCERYPVISQIP